MRRYACVDDQRAAGFPVTAACEAAQVSTSGYYDRCAREAAGPTPRQLAEAELVELMRAIFDAADGNYGVPRRPLRACSPDPPHGWSRWCSASRPRW